MIVICIEGCHGKPLLLCLSLSIPAFIHEYHLQCFLRFFFNPKLDVELFSVSVPSTQNPKEPPAPRLPTPPTLYSHTFCSLYVFKSNIFPGVPLQIQDVAKQVSATNSQTLISGSWTRASWTCPTTRFTLNLC